jgi:hypothetical protein
LRDGSSISHPIGGKAAKKRRIEGYKDDEMLASAANFADISKDRLTTLNEGNVIEKEKNEISREIVPIKTDRAYQSNSHVTIVEFLSQSGFIASIACCR